MAIKKVCGEKKFALTCTVLSEVSYWFTFFILVHVYSQCFLSFKHDIPQLCLLCIEKLSMTGSPWLLCLNKCHVVWQLCIVMQPFPRNYVSSYAGHICTDSYMHFSLQFEDYMGSQKGVLWQECRLECVQCWQRKLFCSPAGLVHVWDGMLCSRGHPHDKQAGSDPNGPCRTELQFHCWASWLLCCPV